MISSRTFSHVSRKRNFTHSISIVDEGVVFIVSCAQIHVILILVSFLSHSRCSLRQWKIINHLSISYQRSVLSTYIFCLEPSRHVSKLIFVIVVVERVQSIGRILISPLLFFPSLFLQS